MKRLEIDEKFIKDFGRRLTHDDFYEDGSINDCFKEYLSTKYKNSDIYIKPFGSFCPDKSEDNINSFVVQFVDRDCIIGKHYNAIALDFIREPNNENNFCYTMGNTWYRHEFVKDGRRFFDGSEKELSYKLVNDVIDFFKNFSF